MIGKLRGIVDGVTESNVVVDVQGVGYEVHCSSRLLQSLENGAEVALVIETHVREDAIRLFGFDSESDRGWFRALQTIQGVGSKVALAVLGTLEPHHLAQAIAAGNWPALAEAPGVGKKLALRMISELKDKPVPGGPNSVTVPVNIDPGQPHPDPFQKASTEAVSALTNLGYQPAQAGSAVAAAIRELGPDADTGALIRRGLRELSR